ncbi:N-acetylglucosamine-6-sulfatase-like [Anopheles cruzii]|uniref:N-acetylglucosamine-6-sulfatase-like n=1 Tax=Anopheles cruzii TaxID=68878 RepID=UPI0022EC70D5|nr:N-acetylglucosamine-6-sulfatase-like [Anopheles cruzii]
MPYAVVCTVLMLPLLTAMCFGLVASTDRKTNYNIVLIVTDDQGMMLQGMTPMTNTLQQIANEGATFANAFTTTPLCCPSRSSILSGQYAHNHKTINNSISGGCYGEYWRQHVEPAALPVALANAGYKTFFAGKYLNEYFSKEIPPGWSEWFGLHGNSRYYNYTINENGTPVQYSSVYFTDYLQSKLDNFLSSMDGKQNFFAMVAPSAPHAPFTPANRHKNLFPDVKAVRTPNFNIPSGPLDKHWLLTMQPSVLPESLMEQLDSIQRKRWQTLVGVDEMVLAIVRRLKEKNLLENTYIFYTSDNGYHIGQFAQAYDKRQPYETDIRVPFLVKGPSVHPKSLSDIPIALIDVAPTILKIAGLQIPISMDGVPIPLNEGRSTTERQILIEYWGEGNTETYNDECPWQAADRLQLCSIDAACHCQDAWNNTYNCVRHVAIDLNFIYCEFKDNEHFVEAYDLSKDLYQMENVGYNTLPSVKAKYSLAITNLSACIGPTCNIIY